MKIVLTLISIAMISPICLAASDAKVFATPQEAVQALIKASERNDTGTLSKIFGTDGKDIVESGDRAEDKHARQRFTQLAHERMTFAPTAENPDKIIFSIGNGDWPFPVPLIRKNNHWVFDAAEGREEILARRIGANETKAIYICRAYAEAQVEYAQLHNHKGVPEYAQKIVSSPGKEDGLYWEPAPGSPECNVPKGFAKAAARMASDKKEPFHGYYFRVLTAQGPDARGGKVSYIVNGSMIGGYALVAWPADYGVSGIQTFIVNHDGIVYETHLGSDTVKTAEQMTEYNPDKSWQPVEPETTLP